MNINLTKKNWIVILIAVIFGLFLYLVQTGVTYEKEIEILQDNVTLLQQEVNEFYEVTNNRMQQKEIEYNESIAKCKGDVKKVSAEKQQKEIELNTCQIYKDQYLSDNTRLINHAIYLEDQNSYLSNLNNVSIFKKVISKVAAEHEYKMNVYDCTEFSEDAAKALIRRGWNAQQYRVVVDCDSGLFLKETCEPFDGRHDIVRVKDVYIEATGGMIIDPIYYEDYGIKG